MMDDTAIFAAIEAMLFVSGEPVAVTDLARALEIAPFQAEEALDRMDALMTEQKRGLRLKRFGGHVQLTTSAEWKPTIEKHAGDHRVPPAGHQAGNRADPRRQV